MELTDEHKANIAKHVNAATHLLISDIEKHFPKVTELESWNQMNEQERWVIRRMFFEMVYEKSDVKFAEDMYNQLAEAAKHNEKPDLPLTS